MELLQVLSTWDNRIHTLASREKLFPRLNAALTHSFLSQIQKVL